MDRINTNPDPLHGGMQQTGASSPVLHSVFGKAKVLGLAASFAFGLVACGGDETEDPVETGSSSSIASSASSAPASSAPASSAPANSSVASSSASSVAAQRAMVYAINVGSDQGYTDGKGVSYQPDAVDFVTTTGQLNGTDDSYTQPIAGTEDDTLYHSQRYGRFTYELPVTEGSYDVTLKMAELYWNAAGARIMSIMVEGQPVMENVDIFSSVQKFTAYDVVAQGVAVNDGNLTIQFDASVDAATASAILVESIGGGRPDSSSSASSVSSPIMSSASSISSSVASSSSVPSSSAASSSSASPMVPGLGDAAAGQALYAEQCVGCHGSFDEMGVSNNTRRPIDAVSYHMTRQPVDVSAEIRDTMPLLDPTLCGQQCADDITAYIWQVGDRVINGEPLPTTSSSASSSSVSSMAPPVVDVANMTGQQLYESVELECAQCHGLDGMSMVRPIKFENFDLETMTKYINDNMPVDKNAPIDPNAPSWCVDECAVKIAEYLWSLKPQVSCDAETVLPRRVRMLTNFEYQNTINDLFGRTDGAELANGLVDDTRVRGFDNNVEKNVINDTRMGAFWSTAEAISKVVDVMPWLNTNNCSQQNDLAACFVEKFGRQAFRRDISADELPGYVEIFAAGETEEQGARMVVHTMLASPNFLYRMELGNTGKLTQYEVASLMSYTFWGSTPDTALLNKAAANELTTVAQLQQAVETLLADEKAKRQFTHFGKQWLHLGTSTGLPRDAELFPAYNDTVGAAMDQEVELFLQEVLLGEGYTMSDFFLGDFVFANEVLAQFYGINGVSGSAMQMVPAGDTRGGVLKLGALLAQNAKPEESHPIHRGLFIRRNLLCQEFAPPPPIDPETLEAFHEFDPNSSQRERVDAHVAIPGCNNCHQYIDDLGFAFQNYNAVGQYTLTEGNNIPVDASGVISGLKLMSDESDRREFGNLNELASILATDGLQPTSECLVEQFQRMMEGVQDPDGCNVSETTMRWQPGTKSIRELWIQTVASQTFTQRQ